VDRRDFVKKAGIGSLAVASGVSFPSLFDAVVGQQSAQAAGSINFVFAVGAVKVGGGELFIANGAGSFNDAQVQAQGSFNHVEIAAAPPFPILGQGTWKAKRLISWAPLGTFGAHASGTLEMEVVLVTDSGERIDATLLVNCNIPPQDSSPVFRSRSS
jgi:hypothetical protein